VVAVRGVAVTRSSKDAGVMGGREHGRLRNMTITLFDVIVIVERHVAFA
jgi:hypothetical protein